MFVFVVVHVHLLMFVGHFVVMLFLFLCPGLEFPVSHSLLLHVFWLRVLANSQVSVEMKVVSWKVLSHSNAVVHSCACCVKFVVEILSPIICFPNWCCIIR